MIRRPPSSTRTYTLCPYTTLFLAAEILHLVAAVRGAVNGLLDEIIVHHLEAHVSRPGLSDAERARGRDDLLAGIDRKSVGEGKSVSVSVDIGGRRILKKNNKNLCNTKRTYIQTIELQQT